MPDVFPPVGGNIASLAYTYRALKKSLEFVMIVIVVLLCCVALCCAVVTFVVGDGERFNKTRAKFE